ncbi:MAG TPA: sulfatase [Thermoanaerobaculia bacterium]|nr:sulfatase [Thermoanaerobaculia bacterium]
MVKRRLAACVALLGAAVFSCSEPEAAAPRPKNVIFILVDTLRADHLGVYGYGRDTSPALDAFAKESLLFENARSQAACTFPSANSILTSRPPTAFLGQPGQAMGIPPGIPSIAEILAGRGYRTAAVSASPVVRNTKSRFNPSGGFGRGFSIFDEACVWKPAHCVNQRASEVLAQKDERPFFLYLHYMDPHGPYRAPEKHRKFSGGKVATDKPFILQGDPNPIGDWLYKAKPDPGVTPAELQHLIDLYDDEIAYFDLRFGEFLASLRKSGLLEDTILVLTADHGEEFLEHGHIKHCRTLFDNSIKIPYLLHIPGVPARSVAAPVQNLDLVPTILDYLGVDAAGLGLEGRSLRPVIEEKLEEKEAGDLRQFAAQGSLRSASDDRYKLIHDLAAGTWALYDLKADPGEKTDALARERRSFHRLRGSLTAWLARTEGVGSESESVRKASEAEKKLRALGYLE